MSEKKVTTTSNDLNKKSTVNADSKNTFGSTNLPPKLKKSTTNEQLNESVKAVGKKVDNVSIQMLTQKQAKALVNKQDLKESTDSIKQTVQNQGNEVIKTAVDTQNIAFNAGVQNNLNGVSQKVDAFQIRLDNQTRNMSDVARTNDAMYADLKGMSDNIRSNTISNNRIAGVIKSLLLGGIQVSTTDVTRSVIDDLNKITGYSIDGLIKDAVYDELERRVKDVKQAQKKAEKAENASSFRAKQCEKYAAKTDMLDYNISRCINRVLFELFIGLAIAAVVPGWWKAPAIMTVAIISWLFNKGVDNL